MSRLFSPTFFIFFLKYKERIVKNNIEIKIEYVIGWAVFLRISANIKEDEPRSKFPKIKKEQIFIRPI